MISNNVSYEYDGDGYRKYKTVGTEPKIMYSYVGGVLRSQKSADREMLYFYDEKGTIAGVKVIEDGAETIYYYQLNIQGDVIGIINEDGVQVVAYTYDEWGNVLSITGSESTGIGELNPIRYRGYYYDSESGFYYLLSRYYDPETGRFINADDYGYLGASGTLLGYNLFAYCENNAVIRVDTNGEVWRIIAGVAVYRVIDSKYKNRIVSNYNHNKKLYNKNPLNGALIDNQNDLIISQYRYGFYNTGYNGCGWIATYNACRVVGIYAKPYDVIRALESYGLNMWGTFGTNLKSIKEYFNKRGYKVTVTSSLAKCTEVAKCYSANIIYYLHSRGTHFVTLRTYKTYFRAYNDYYFGWGNDIKKFMNEKKYKFISMLSIHD